jgi:hypothetical protein
LADPALNPARRGTATITDPSVVRRRRVAEEHDRGSRIEPESTVLHRKGLQAFRRRQALNFGSVVKSSSCSPKRFSSDDFLLTAPRFDPATLDRLVFPLCHGDSLTVSSDHCVPRRRLMTLCVH